MPVMVASPAADTNTSPRKPSVNTLPTRYDLPSELVSDDHLLSWDYVWKNDDWAKVPFDVHIAGAWGSSTDPKTQGTFEQAIAMAQRNKLAGIGRAIHEDDPYVGIDLDDCRNPETGELTDRAQKIVRAFNSYGEISPSLTGVKIWTRGCWGDRDSDLAEGIEVYGKGRYFTLTGLHLPDTPLSVEERQQDLDDLYRALRPDQPQQQFTRAVPINEKIVYKTRHNVLASLAGSLRERGLNATEMYESLMAVNNSRCEPPLPAAEVRELAEDFERRYQPGSSLNAPQLVKKPAPRTSSSSRPYVNMNEMNFEGEPVDLSTVADPGPVKYEVEDLIPENYPTSFYGDGGQGKSYIVLHLLACITAGKPFLGKAVKQGTVLYLDWELDPGVQRYRYGLVSKGCGLDAPPAGLIYKRMSKPLQDSLEDIYAWLDKHHPVLIVVDSYGRACGGDPVDHQAVIAFNVALETLGTSFVVDHQSKPSADNYASKREFGSAYKGHYSRCSWQVERVGEDAGRVGLVIRHKKSNFGRLLPDITANLTFEEVDGLLQQVKLEPAESSEAVAGTQFGLRGKVIAALKGTTATVDDLCESIPDAERGSIANEVTALKRVGLVVEVAKNGRKPVLGLKSDQPKVTVVQGGKPSTEAPHHSPPTSSYSEMNIMKLDSAASHRCPACDKMLERVGSYMNAGGESRFQCTTCDKVYWRPGPKEEQEMSQ